MCPGGIIAPAATAPRELVVNGWSPSKRNNPFANSGMVVQVEIADAEREMKKVKPHTLVEADKSLQPMWFQQTVEQRCFEAGGGNFRAPAQRMADFSYGSLSTSLPACSYQPGIVSTQLSEVLPGFVYRALAKGFIEFGKKMKGFLAMRQLWLQLKAAHHHLCAYPGMMKL
jgi:uncharacterized FAD-dependent dehydrogenase